MRGDERTLHHIRVSRLADTDDFIVLDADVSLDDSLHLKGERHFTWYSVSV